MVQIQPSLISITLSLIVIFACNSAPKVSSLDLMKYGLPITINAPDSAVVQVDDMGVWKDVTVQKGKSFYVQILSSKATSNDISLLKSESLNEVKAGRFFSKIIQEDDAGFIFEKKIDDSINYDFRFFKIQGDSEYSFQTGLIGTFTEKQVRDMYASVQ